MMNYIELERKLKALGLKKGNRRSVNFITPDCVGFLPICKEYTAEISYGRILDCYIIGFTLFKNGKPCEFDERCKYSKSFSVDEIDDIKLYAQDVARQLTA